MARNKVNGKCYVGKTKGSMKERKIGHYRDCIRANHYSAFYNALRKYGPDFFEWSVLDECDDLKVLNALERLFIRRLNTRSPNGYNLTDGGDGQSNPTPEIRLKMRLAKLGKTLTVSHRMAISRGAINSIHYETQKKRLSDGRDQLHPMDQNIRDKISKTLIGHPVSPETREKLRKAGLGKPGNMKGCKHSEETRKKISEAGKGRIATPESNAKRRATLKGRYFSPEHRKKISEALRKRALLAKQENNEKEKKN